MSKHTPGPIVVELAKGVGGTALYYEIRELGDFRGQIASVWWNEWLGLTQEDALANAVLFHAAPDMLEALEDCESWLATYRPDAVDTLARARAAIAKAKGEA